MVKPMLASLVAIALMLSGCRSLAQPSWSVDLLRSAPEVVTLDKITYQLDTELWRDFMPISPPEGLPLMAIARVTATNASHFPATVRADRFWLLGEEGVWETEFSNAPRPDGGIRGNQLEAIATAGPLWEPGREVEAVVSLVDGQHHTYLLRAAHQRIDRTD